MYPVCIGIQKWNLCKDCFAKPTSVRSIEKIFSFCICISSVSASSSKRDLTLSFVS